MKVKILIDRLHSILHHRQSGVRTQQQQEDDKMTSEESLPTPPAKKKALSDITDLIFPALHTLDHDTPNISLALSEHTAILSCGMTMREDYVLRQCIYNGLCVQVWLAWQKSKRALVAMKVKILGSADSGSVYNDAMFQREIRIHTRIEHNHILQAYGEVRDHGRIFLVLEYDSFVDLRTYMARRGITMLSVRRTQYIVLRVLKALAYLHERSICHRDVKPSNVLVNSRGDVKLCDFGYSIDLNEEAAVTRCGSALYMAPEVRTCPLKGTHSDNKDRADIAYSTSADVWSLGAMTFELLFGLDALRNVNLMTYAHDTTHLPMKSRTIEFIRACLHRSIRSRATCRELLKMSWMKRKRLE